MPQDLLQALVLGLAQGLGEFLPISSTAHLAVLPFLFRFPDPGLNFDVALHAGTLVAVLGYFWKDWVVIFRLTLRSIIGKEKKIGRIALEDETEKEYPRNIAWFLMIATVPGVLAGYFFEEKAETVLRHPLVVAGALFFAGLILYLVDKFLKHEGKISSLCPGKALLLGLAQATAIIPGVSRSGVTISAGLMIGLGRREAAKFSFLMSTPIILGATVLKIEYLLEGMNISILVGIITSAVSGYLAIKYLLVLAEKIGYGVFFWYRAALAVLILLIYYSR